MDDKTVANDSTGGYTVVARRYRPRSFAELIGQDHIAHALSAAVEMGRVGHAYLFTGARGVGKTSTARIFAKVLNAPASMDGELAADIAQSIDSGEDMDVIEIDGASNRGIEEIRQLRANVNVRPSRARYKIYIIDEVHMLTNQAFNALLKTLEEPPQHVKFIFCTTDPDKLPITVLSRCQRFDFVPVKLEAIQGRLQEICTAEGFAADDEALALLARRAAGSMRDSQSLLEQVMSFATDRITVDQVHQLLGIADEGRLLEIAQAVAGHDALQAVQFVEQATRGGADAGQLAEQLLNYFRDLMAIGIGGGPELLKLANPSGFSQLKELAESLGVQTVLSAIQILDESLVRMRTSVAAGTLLEVALVQICQLTNLSSIPALLEAVLDSSSGMTPRPNTPSQRAPQKKNSSQLATEHVAATAHSGAAAANMSAAAPKLSAAAPSASQPESAAQRTTDAPPSNHQVATATGKPPTEPSAAAVTAVAAHSATAELGPEKLGPEKPVMAETASATQRAPAENKPPNAGRPALSPPASVGDASVAGASSGALQQWRQAIASIDDMLADFAGMAVAVSPSGSDQWNVTFPPGAVRPRDYCEQPERRSALQAALEATLGRTIQLRFSVMPGEAPKPVAVTQPSTNRVQKLREASENRFVKKLCEALDGEILRVDPPSPGFAPSGGKVPKP